MKVYGRNPRRAVLPLVSGVAVYAMVLALTAGHPLADHGGGGGGNAGGFLLKGHPVPDPTTLGDYVTDRAAAIQLGKSLFWDAQAGSDGVQGMGGLIQA